MHLDHDILYLLFIASLVVVFGIPGILRTILLPRDLQFEEVPQKDLTPQQSEFLSPYDSKLAALGFQPFTTFRVPNMIGHNLIRIYLSSADPAKCALTLVAAKNKSLFSSHVEFATKYADGTRLVINNNSVTGIFDDMPGVIIHRYKGVTDLAELKRRHDREAEKLRPRGVVFYTADNYFDDFRQFHQDYCQHQVSKKLLHWDSKSGVYRATPWTALRGIRNFFNPLADNFSLARLLAGMVLGAGLPVFAIVERIPISSWLQAHAGQNGSMAAAFVPLFAYGIAGISVGVLFSRRTFVWAVLLGILPSRLLFGFAETGYCLWMAAVADLSGRVNNRRKNVL